jgi:hypothetical protein
MVCLPSSSFVPNKPAVRWVCEAALGGRRCGEFSESAMGEVGVVPWHVEGNGQRCTIVVVVGRKETRRVAFERWEK